MESREWKTVYASSSSATVRSQASGVFLLGITGNLWYYFIKRSGGQAPPRYPLRGCEPGCERPDTGTHPIFIVLQQYCR